MKLFPKAALHVLLHHRDGHLGLTPRLSQRGMLPHPALRLRHVHLELLKRELGVLTHVAGVDESLRAWHVAKGV